MPPSSESNGGKNGVLLTCIHWVQKQVQNARNAAPLSKWPDAVLFSKETAKERDEKRDGDFSRFVRVYGNAGVHRLVHRGVQIVGVESMMTNDDIRSSDSF